MIPSLTLPGLNPTQLEAVRTVVQLTGHYQQRYVESFLAWLEEEGESRRIVVPHLLRYWGEHENFIATALNTFKEFVARA